MKGQDIVKRGADGEGEPLTAEGVHLLNGIIPFVKSAPFLLEEGPENDADYRNRHLRRSKGLDRRRRIIHPLTTGAIEHPRCPSAHDLPFSG